VAGVLPIRPRGKHVSVRVSPEKVGRVGEADGHAPVTRVGNVFEQDGPYWLLAALEVDVGRQRGALGALCSAKVGVGELLHQVGVVQGGGSRGLRLSLLDGDGLGTAAAQVGARLLRLALRAVYDAALEDALGLHGSNAREDLQNLIMAGGRDLAIQQQLVHGGELLGRSEPRSEPKRIDMQFACVNRGVDKDTLVARSCDWRGSTPCSGQSGRAAPTAGSLDADECERGELRTAPANFGLDRYVRRDGSFDNESIAAGSKSPQTVGVGGIAFSAPASAASANGIIIFMLARPLLPPSPQPSSLFTLFVVVAVVCLSLCLSCFTALLSCKSRGSTRLHLPENA
jgi:hypothetical protein